MAQTAAIETVEDLRALHEAPPPMVARGYWGTVANRLKYDPVTLFFAFVILAIVVVSIAAPWIAPKDPLKRGDDVTTAERRPCCETT